MSKKSPSKTPTKSADRHYEYRVWGKHKSARKALRTLATDRTVEQFADCYLLGDDPGFNAKVRDRSLKVKQLVGQKKGFEAWETQWHTRSKTAPAPFDDVLIDLGIEKRKKGKSFNLQKAVNKLDPKTRSRVVFVTKDRTRYRIGNVRAEVTDITIESTGEVLRTLAIEGDDLDELVALRKKLGLKKSDNVAVHVAIDDA